MIYSLPLSKALKADPLKFETFTQGGPNKIVNWPVDSIIDPKLRIVIPEEGLAKWEDE